jgi:hypothetical protein
VRRVNRGRLSVCFGLVGVVTRKRYLVSTLHCIRTDASGPTHHLSCTSPHSTSPAFTLIQNVNVLYSSLPPVSFLSGASSALYLNLTSRSS